MYIFRIKNFGIFLQQLRKFKLLEWIKNDNAGKYTVKKSQLYRKLHLHFNLNICYRRWINRIQLSNGNMFLSRGEFEFTDMNGERHYRKIWLVAKMIWTQDEFKKGSLICLNHVYQKLWMKQDIEKCEFDFLLVV